ncbi:MAG: type II toxin-antitoxin system RelE/ParE family toxin [Phenylobacterium sp.]|uniref:type II toxin-antitoxin system RelE/ParE family toxin n=1 Tax=Phenylobacterium sp. TaxID=1871053 RepID=UPI001B5C02F3|nr:type II toxin-antitoxin system RelE/ParE family toxin [Phenylobacterium sp.]MBP7814746.1 type II toxin-antitoxin system RelE/ParE family toxin [Phenylobacterium sp.]MBP9232343.1 type II toxin-antitoxin system RelE/ParE family toxin [Phenylobacterium sp.]MBP9754742.1 type II toxin-antitoxin system RelE/ParE family toxin [Phenylobacterium sp.]
MKVIWASSARDDVNSIVLHIAEDNVDAALRMGDRIESAVGRLDSISLRTRRGRVDGTRELVVTGTPYVVVLAITDDVVGVVRVLHGAQAWPPQGS